MSGRFTWVDEREVTWRVERLTDDWRLTWYDPAVGEWRGFGDYPSRGAALEVAQLQASKGIPAVVRRRA
jgi:hypothetical protein